ncbi:sugar phosphate isomerase/epimerase family protein [Paenibacillus agricola]|uniref:Sugar phosphate isomerase/epimerase n=1 Tax=Paenibacillus agricola TaxID=2716264 RepID=A0ABX0J7L0_9BACL|nr:sugar phosphate isomerase/epimerase family protein [Paenibacillus agricola]NHN31375.1 sugar phosphate isomerase/epimerase [Paenibacillus agricola]
MTTFGWCMPIEHAEELQKYGYDYIECAVAPLLTLDDVAFKKALPLYVNSAIPVKAWNVLFPGDIKVVGPEVNEEIVRKYLARAVETMVQAGSSIFVFGSGRSRSIPEGWERARAEEQILSLLNIIAGELKGTNLVLAIEPLNTKESNIITSVSEGVYFAKQINDPAIRVLADFYHMDEESEPLDTIVANKDWLSHIHVADTGRLAPGTGQYPYESFVAQLKAAGYNGMVSAECTLNDRDKELPASLEFMKSQWAAQGVK